MTKNTILSLLFFFTAFPFVGFAQKVHPFDPYYGYAENVMPSVEAFSMSKYGMASPSLYTGSMSYEVPLYMYADPDFQIPLTLTIVLVVISLQIVQELWEWDGFLIVEE